MMLQITISSEGQYAHVAPNDWRWTGIVARVEERASRVGGCCPVCQAMWMVTRDRAAAGCYHLKFVTKGPGRWEITCPSAFGPDVDAVHAMGVTTW